MLAAGLSYVGGYWAATWWNKWGIMLTGIVLLAAVKPPKRMHWALWWAGASTVLSAFYAMTFRGDYDIVLTMPERVQLHQDAGYTLFAFIALAWFFGRAKKQTLLTVEDTLAYVGLANACAIIFQAIWGMRMDARGGLLGNPSISASFTAITYAALVMQPHEPCHPSMLKTFRRMMYLAVPVVAILLTGSSVALATLGVVVFFRFVHVKKVGYLVVLPPLFLAVGWLIKGEQLLSDSGRFMYWNLALTFWWDNFSPWVGSGTGTVQRLVPLIQSRFVSYSQNSIVGLWSSNHSTWLDVLFMQGVVGLTPVVAIAVGSLKRAWSQPHLRAAVAGYLFAMTFNSLSYWPMHAMLGACLISLCYPLREE